MHRAWAWALICALVAIFALLWVAERVGGTQPFDREGLVAVHQYVGTGAVQHWFATFTAIGYYRDYIPFLGFVVLGFLLLRWIMDALRLVFTYVGAELTTSIVKQVAERPRPVEPWTLTHPQTFSFPSGHATVAVAVFAFIAVLVARHLGSPWRPLLIIIGVLLALLLAFSRLALAVHFPSDVVAGLAVGTIWALLSFQLPAIYGSKKTRKETRIEEGSK